jgi:hypothetical protein
MNAISRRAALAGVTAACALSAIGHPVSADTADLTQTLLSVVADRSSAAALGESWINHKRGGATKPANLPNHLADILRAQGWSGGSDPAELRQRLNAAVRADYQNGETVMVGGWQLAKTQAELCALAYYATAGLL